jgi:hypothetical protein
MAETGPEQRLKHDVDELDHRIEKLGEHIHEAERKADEMRADDAAGTEVAGDYHDTEGGPMFGEDPEGAERDTGKRSGD